MIRPLNRDSRSIERLTCLDGETIEVRPAMRHAYPRLYRAMVACCVAREIVGRYDGRQFLADTHRPIRAKRPERPGAAQNGRTSHDKGRGKG